LARRGQTLLIDAGLGGAIYVFVESGGEHWWLVEKGVGTVDGGGGIGKGQAEKVSEAARIHKINGRCPLTVSISKFVCALLAFFGGGVIFHAILICLLGVHLRAVL
jgi:hypothetical protein